MCVYCIMYSVHCTLVLLNNIINNKNTKINNNT